MIGLFFELIPLDGHAPRYFELAAALKPELERNGGLLFIDRYSSVDRPDVVLSHSWWESEEALIRWREHSKHRAIQRAGREHHFRDYRLRIARLADPSQVATMARCMWASYYDAEPIGHAVGEPYRSVYREGKFLVLGEGERLRLLFVMVLIALAAASSVLSVHSIGQSAGYVLIRATSSWRSLRLVSLAQWP